MTGSYQAALRELGLALRLAPNFQTHPSHDCCAVTHTNIFIEDAR